MHGGTEMCIIIYLFIIINNRKQFCLKTIDLLVASIELAPTPMQG